MANDQMLAQMRDKPGFIAALDQSGGSTPGALRQYGIPDSAYSGDAEMFRLIHEMRVRIISAPAFTGEKVIGAILFEATMDGQAQGKPVPAFLWNERGVVPFLKVDKGLEAEAEQLLRDELLEGLDALPASQNVMIKLTIPDTPDFYLPLIEHPRVVRVVALSGGYTRTDACERLAKNHGMIASFSRALINDLTKPMSDAGFDTALAASIDEIWKASVQKV